MIVAKTGWYVIYTKPNHEKIVVKCLDHLEIQNFLPITKTLKIWASKKKYIHLPLFPSYVFVKLNSKQLYLQSLQIPGILYYIKTDNQIAEVSETIINKLQAIGSGNVENLEVSSERFSEGTHLDIKEGPFKGFECEVIEHRGKQKVLVRLELLRRNITVDLPVYCLTENN